LEKIIKLSRLKILTIRKKTAAKGAETLESDAGPKEQPKDI